MSLVSLRSENREEVVVKGANVIVYEPALEDGPEFYGSLVINDLSKFRRRSGESSRTVMTPAWTT